MGTIMESLGESASKRIKLDHVELERFEIGEDCQMEDISLAEDEPEIPSHRNPFLFSPVLTVLFSHMDMETLKSARQVCQLWNSEVAPVFLEKSKVAINLEEICHYSCLHRKINAAICQCFLDMIKTTLTDASKLPFHNLHINYMDMHCERKMSKMFRAYGSRLNSLSIMFCNSQYDDDEDDYNQESFFSDEDFKLILLYWCTNLKTLELLNIPFSITENDENIFLVEELIDRKSYIPGGPVSSITGLKISDDRNYFPLHKNFVFHLLKVSPHLTSIEIDVEDDDAFEPFLEGLLEARKAGFLKNLDSLIFGTRFGCVFFENHLVTLLAMNLRQLKRLEILNMGQDMSAHTLTKLFHICNDSLEVFRLGLTDVTNAAEIPDQILCLPRMKNLKHLEIKCEQIKLSENINCIRQFPQLRTCILELGCPCSFEFAGKHWKTITLKCGEFTYFNSPRFNKSEEDLQIITFQYEAHCGKNFERIGNWFPTLKSVYVSEGSRFGNPFELLELFYSLKYTDVEEIFLDRGCMMSLGHPCCRNGSIEEEEREFEMSLHKFKSLMYPSLENIPKNFEKNVFPELRKVKIVSQGCRNINLIFFKQIGIVRLIEDAPELEDFSITYSFQNINKTVLLYDLNQRFEAEQ